MSRRSFVAASACMGMASLGILSGCSSQAAPSAPEADKAEPVEAPVEKGDEELATTGDGNVVYIVDRLEAKPGDGKAFYEDFMTNMKPIMEAAGWTFVRATVSPAIWMDTDSTVIEIEWTMPDIAQAAWAYSSATRYNPDYVQWWAQAHSRAVSINRIYSASPEYMEVLNNV